MTRSVLVVDDSFIMRTIIKDIVESDPALEVVGMAENGKVGLQRVRELKPEVIILDIEMPEMNGLDMLKRLSLISKAKVVVVSSIARIGSAEAVTARKFGASDIVEKPSGAMSLDLEAKKGHAILRAIRQALGMQALGTDQPPAG